MLATVPSPWLSNTIDSLLLIVTSRPQNLSNHQRMQSEQSKTTEFGKQKMHAYMFSGYTAQDNTGKSAFGIMGYIHGIKWVYTISAWYMTFC
jgi:hypothetical protein